MLEVDHEGLDRLDREILAAICAKFDGGPVGLSTLAVAVGEESDTIEDVYEPYLLQKGLLKRTPRGRMATPAAFRHSASSRPTTPSSERGAVMSGLRRLERLKPAAPGDDALSVRDERLIMGRWSGALWLLAGAVGAAGQAMPGVPHDHVWLAWTLIAISVVYGAACLTGVIPWERVSYGGHLAAIIAWQPLLALALWASGGVDSYVQPVFILALLYAAYFMPGWMAWVGVGALVVTNATPRCSTPARASTRRPRGSSRSPSPARA